MLVEINQSNSYDLFLYFKSISKRVPYFYNVDYEDWSKSMFQDIDYDGDELFNELKTYVFLENELIKGYIQFGTTFFEFSSDMKDYNKHVGIIRNLYYEQPNDHIGKILIQKAIEYFDNSNIERYAFYHYFGMSCYARYGKLHESLFYMEELLEKHSFIKGHENVFYSKDLSTENFTDTEKLVFCYSEISSGNQQNIKFLINGHEIGSCILYYMPKCNVAYLGLIFIAENCQHQGYGTICMSKLFYEMKKRGFTQLDTDTMDSNYVAQSYYIKNGFRDKGRTRGYWVV